MPYRTNIYRDIEVTYDGKFPCTCSGTLTIKVDGKEIYKKDYCCHSTGSVTFDEDWNENVFSGELIWDEELLIPEDIRLTVKNAVRIELSKHEVCCGGCV